MVSVKNVGPFSLLVYQKKSWGWDPCGGLRKINFGFVKEGFGLEILQSSLGFKNDIRT